MESVEAQGFSNGIALYGCALKWNSAGCRNLPQEFAARMDVADNGAHLRLHGISDCTDSGEIVFIVVVVVVVVVAVVVAAAVAVVIMLSPREGMDSLSEMTR